MTTVQRRTRARGELPQKAHVEYGSVVMLPGGSVSVVVLGQPAPQGSKIVSQYGGMKESNVRTEGWRKAIAKVCKEGLPADFTPLDEALTAEFWFFFDPPKAAEKGDLPTTRATYDGDKLQRAMCDGLQDGGVIKDDARIVDFHAYKRYVWPGEGEARAVVIVSPHRTV